MEVPAEGWLDLLCLQIAELKQLPLGEYERRSSWFPSILVFLFGKYLDRRTGIFPLSRAASFSTVPPGLKRVQVPDVSSQLPFFITSFLDAHDSSYWTRVVARGCAAVTVFLAFLHPLVGCAVELSIARGSARADISGRHHEKTILGLWRSWEGQQQRTTAGPGRMRAVVLGRPCLLRYGSVPLRG